MPAATTSRTTSSVAPAPDAPARLRAVVGRLYRHVNAGGRGTGLTPSQLSALGSIARHGPLRMSELAEIEIVNPTMLSRIVAALDDAGLVRRTVDPVDRRAGRVEVTAAGRRTHDRLRAERGRVLAAGLDRLSAPDRRAVEAALPALENLLVELGR